MSRKKGITREDRKKEGMDIRRRESREGTREGKGMQRKRKRTRRNKERREEKELKTNNLSRETRKKH